MADNPSGPASAPPSAGSATAGTTTAGANPPGAAAAPGGDVVARFEAALAAERAERTNLRSLHDRQMNELRAQVQQALAVRRNGAGDTDDDDGAGAAAAVPSYDPVEDEERGLTMFRQDFPDWATYWPRIEPIASDQAKAAAFIALRRNPKAPGGYSVDYRRSLANIRAALELEDLRKAKAEFDQARTASEQRKSALRSDAFVSGEAAAALDALDWGKMSAAEKAWALLDAGMIEVNEADPPSWYKEGRPKRA